MIPGVVRLTCLIAIALASGLAALGAPPPEAYVPQLNFADESDPILKAVNLAAEPYLPVAYDFDGNADPSDNGAHYQRGKTDGPQKPTLYFHRAAQPVSIGGTSHAVYEYWLYFAAELLTKPSDHDWECYLVYLKQAEVDGAAGGDQAPPVPTQVGLSYHSHLDVYPWDGLSRLYYSPGPGQKIGSLQVEGGTHALRTGVGLLGSQPVPTDLASLAPFFPGLTAQTWAEKANEFDARQRGARIAGADWTIVPADGLKNPPEAFGALPAPWRRAEWNQPPAISSPLAGGTRVASSDGKNVNVQPAGDKPTPVPPDKPKPPEDKPKPPPPPPPPPPPTEPGAIAAPTVTAPRANDRVGKKVTVEGTATPGILVVTSVDVIDPDTGEFIKEIPGARRVVDAQGNFKVMIAAPRLWNDTEKPLRYVLKVWALDDAGRKSGVVRIPLLPE